MPVAPPARGRRTQTDWYITLGVFWGASVGYGAFVCLLSGDWVAASLSCLSAAAMVGGICFRNFGAPRLVAVMILLSLGLCCPAAALSGQPIMLLTLLQIPFYVAAMSIAAFRLNKLLVSTMKAERENDRRARHDPLTGLPNRAGLLHAFASLTDVQAAAEGCGTALLYLDLDGFKPVNDQYGHAVGDALLVAVAERLRATLCAGDLVARIGGDEFVMLARISHDIHVSRLADTLIEKVSKPYALGPATTVKVSASIGIALVENGADGLDTALQKADAALYLAKAGGKTRWSLAA